MTDSVDAATDSKPKKSKMPLLLGLVLAIVGAGGGFYAVNSGLLLGQPAGENDANAPQMADVQPLRDAPADLAYVPLDPLVISVRDDAGQAHLRFTAQLEVVPAYESDVVSLKPRIIDVLNGYLRAVSVAEMSDPLALIRLRAQMLRRIQVVTGEGRVKDLLVMEFILN